MRYILTVGSISVANTLLFYWRNKIIYSLTDERYIHINYFSNIKINYEKVIGSGKINFHGKMLAESVSLLPDDAFVLIIDNDAYPLSKIALEDVFQRAAQFKIAGNIQRTNCINNDEHLFIGPSYICFQVRDVKKMGEMAWVVNERSDTGEEISWLLSKDVSSFAYLPKSSLFKPVWDLNKSIKSYGVGTKFSDSNGREMSYHHFYSRIIIARIHFFIISFFHFYKIRFQKMKFKMPGFRIEKIKHAVLVSIKYLLGKIE